MFEATKGALNGADFLFFLIILSLLRDQVDLLISQCESLLATHIAEQRRLNRLLPRHVLRPTFQQFMETITPSHFKRMFRMPVSTFKALCQKICDKIGIKKFRSEEYLGAQRQRLYGSAEPREQANAPISGEVKVAVAIRMLAGGSYLDLIPLFQLSGTHLYDVLDDFLDWVLETLDFPLTRWLEEDNWREIKRLADAFGRKTSGIFYGPFAALDGLAVRIKCPILKDAPDPKSFYCRKGFFALNVQAMCDRHKYFLWCNPSNKGSTHDSTAWALSVLHDVLEQKAEMFKNLGIFVASDSAYSLTPYMQTPYDKVELQNDPLGMKDAFNFYLSSCRIYIECAFGELVMRWGILWRTLQFRLKKCMKVVKVCMLLHNFIIDHQDENERNDTSYFENFDIEMDAIQNTITEKTNEVPVAMVSDNNEPNPGGRPSNDAVKAREIGEEIRSCLAVKLSSHGMTRPLQSGMHYNQYGHIYMSS